MNDLTIKKSANSVAAATDPWMAAAQRELGAAFLGDALLKFVKGTYTLGGKPVGATQTFIVNINEFWLGFDHWQDGNITNRVIERFDNPVVPDRNKLGKLDETRWELGPNGQPRDPWQAARYIGMRNTATNQAVVFVTGSWGGQKFFGRLLQRISEQKAKHPFMCPIINLASQTRQADHGPVLEPVFTIVGWDYWDAAAKAAAAEAAKKNPPTLAEELDDEIPF